MRDYTFRYSVEMKIANGYMTPAGWATRSRVGATVPAYLAGKPSAAKLARYVADYNASLKPGGVNEHLGPGARCLSARILDHNNDRRVVAEW
jgi:hypothetical protein